MYIIVGIILIVGVCFLVDSIGLDGMCISSIVAVCLAGLFAIYLLNGYTCSEIMWFDMFNHEPIKYADCEIILENEENSDILASITTKPMRIKHTNDLVVDADNNVIGYIYRGFTSIGEDVTNIYSVKSDFIPSLVYRYKNITDDYIILSLTKIHNLEIGKKFGDIGTIVEKIDKHTYKIERSKEGKE